MTGILPAKKMRVPRCLYVRSYLAQTGTIRAARRSTLWADQQPADLVYGDTTLYRRHVEDVGSFIWHHHLPLPINKYCEDKDLFFQEVLPSKSHPCTKLLTMLPQSFLRRAATHRLPRWSSQTEAPTTVESSPPYPINLAVFLARESSKRARCVPFAAPSTSSTNADWVQHFDPATGWRWI